MKKLRIIIPCIIILLISFVPLYNMLIDGIYNWHIHQPEFVEGGLELLTTGLLIFIGYIINDRKVAIPLIIGGAIYLSLNGVILPVFVDLVYFSIICYYGYSFLSFKNTETFSSKLVKSFFVGIIVWMTGAILFSILKLGTINPLRIYTVALFIVLLIVNKYRKKKIKIGNLIEKMNNYKNTSIVYTILFIVIFLIVFALFAKTNTCYDYDSLWYGLRSQYALIGKNSFYDNLNYISFVYYYPKLSELFFLPLNGFNDYSFIICGNIMIFSLTLLTIKNIINENLKLDSNKNYNIIILSMFAAIPAFANISATAKGDILGYFFLFFSFYLISIFRKNKNYENLVFAVISIALSTTAKLTCILWGGILFLWILLLLFAEKGKLKKNLSKLFLAIKKNWILLLLSIFVFFGIHIRTFIFTRYFIYPIGLNFWNSIFNFQHGWFLGNETGYLAVNSGIDFSFVISRIYGFIINPKDLPHILPLWTSNLAIVFSTFWFFNKKNKFNKSDFALILVCFLVSIYYMITMPQPDGNYFIFPIVIISILLLRNLKPLNSFIINRVYKILFIFVLITLLPIMFVSHFSWSWGTKSFDSILVKDNFETLKVNEGIFDNYGLSLIYNKVKEFDVYDKVIASQEHDTLYYRLLCNLELYTELTNPAYSDANYSIYENFVNINKSINLKAFIVDKEDSTDFPSLVEKYVNEYGYLEKIEDTSATMYIIR